MPFSASPIASAEAQGTSSGATTSAIDTTGADLLVLALESYVGSTEPTVSDSKGNTWIPLTAIGDLSGNTCRTRIYYAKNPTVGSGHTFSANGASSFPAIAVTAWSGADLTAPFDQESQAEADSTVIALAPGSVTPTSSDELLVAAWGHAAPGEPSSPGVNGGFTLEGSLGNMSGTAFGVAHAWLVQGSATAANPTLTWGGMSWASASIATFKAAAPPPAPDVAYVVEPPAVDSVWQRYIEVHAMPLAFTRDYVVPPPPPPPPPPSTTPVISVVGPAWAELVDAWAASTVRPMQVPGTTEPTMPPTPLPQASTVKPFLPRAPDAPRREREFQDKVSILLNSLMGRGEVVEVESRKFALGGGILATRGPTAADDRATGAIPGKLWVNTTANRVWVCVSNAADAAVWLELATA